MGDPTREFFDLVHSRYGDPEIFVEMVLERMDTLELDRTDLAKASGVDYNNLCRWLRHAGEPTMMSMVLVDEALWRLEQLILESME